ncbi:MAG: discoidin domain-containing protein [Candidatus Zixiibacteriota bacterium]
MYLKKIKIWQVSFILLTFILISGCIPEPYPYPYRPASEIREEAQEISDSLQAYIEGWLDGDNPPEIPERLLPEGIVDAHSYRLLHPDSVEYDDIWAWRLAEPINLDSVHHSLPDPNVTYLLMGPALAPFGSSVHIEGEFPHCRFFSIQMSPPLSGEEYCYNRAFGPAEVSIADVDIDPLPGHDNPFRVGEDRDAENRSYHVTFDLRIGNAVELSDGDFAPPYRYPGNTRYGGLLQYQGPWGVDGGFDGIMPAHGEWNIGALWVRMYLPDGEDPLCGVDYPKVYYELPDGRDYFITANFDALIEHADSTVAAQETYTSPNAYIDISKGWLKSYGIIMNILCGYCQANGITHPDTMAKLREVDLGATGRSQFADPPRNYEAHSTVNNYTSYLGRFVRVDTGEVAVLTGKLPTFPDTKSGLSSMIDTDCRYFSIVGYDNDPFFEAPGSAINAIRDDQIIVDEYGNYMICYSRHDDRPENANEENKVTHVRWGPTMDLGLIIRIVTLGDLWNFEQSPNDPAIAWDVGNFASPTFDNTLLYQNWHRGYMDCYQPRLHIMRKEKFESLGDGFSVIDVPITVHDKSEVGLSDIIGSPIEASSENEEGDFAAINANDDDFDSYWASENLMTVEQTEWLAVDLGEEKRVSAIKISWVILAQAIEYEILGSVDSSSWFTIYETEEGIGGNEIIDNLHVDCRYIKLKMDRCVLYNYGIHNFEVHCPSCDCLISDEHAIEENPIRKQSDINIRVYPNPIEDFFSISSNIDIEKIEIYDIQGRLRNIDYDSDQIKIDGTKGVYLIRVETEEEVILKRIAKVSD